MSTSNDSGSGKGPITGRFARPVMSGILMGALLVSVSAANAHPHAVDGFDGRSISRDQDGRIQLADRVTGRRTDFNATVSNDKVDRGNLFTDDRRINSDDRH